MPFTEYQLQRLKPGATRRVITETGVSPDLRGLQLRVAPTGTKSWFLRYKADGRTRWLALGAYPTVSLADAHRMVQEHRAAIRDGKDPAVAHQAKVRANRSAPTVQDVYEEFRDHYLRRKRKRPEQPEGVLENHILPTWGPLKAADISRRQIIERIREIRESGTPRVAEIVKLLLGQMYGYAVDNALLEANPATRIPVIGSRGEKKERTLADDEIKTFWEKLDSAKMVPNLRIALRLLLVTGQRRQEIALARWSEFDLKAKLWTIPAEHSKNGKAHQVPLSKLALSLLSKIDVKGSAYVIRSRLKNDQPIDPMALTRAVKNNDEHFEIPAFTPHDLRRTAASGMAALGVQRFHIAQVLNHSDSSVTARYDRHDYVDEKRDALNQWAKHIDAVLAGRVQKVTSIEKAWERKARARARQ
jgi:integrase